jgi:glucose-1-phosphate thymidylyltransferase
MHEFAGLILAGGQGLRLKPLTDTRLKPMLPVAGKPILEYNIERLAAAGVREIAIVVPPDSDEIVRAFGSGRRFGVTLAYIIQEQPLGTAHAVAVAHSALGDRPFYMTFGDNLTPWDISRLAPVHERHRAATTVALFRAADPRKHGVAELDGERVLHLIERPEHPPSEWAVAGMYLLEAIIFEAITHLRARDKGEYWLPDAVEWLIQQGRPVAAAKVDPWRTNVNPPEEYLEANRLLLSDGTAAPPALVCSVCEPVCVGAGSQADETARLGPAASCGAGCRIGAGAVVENSVLLDRVIVEPQAVVRDSLIGEGAVIPRGAVVVGRVIGDRARA